MKARKKPLPRVPTEPPRERLYPYTVEESPGRPVLSGVRTPGEWVHVYPRIPYGISGALAEPCPDGPTDWAYLADYRVEVHDTRLEPHVRASIASAAGRPTWEQVGAAVVRMMEGQGLRMEDAADAVWCWMLERGIARGWSRLDVGRAWLDYLPTRRSR